MRNLKRTLSLVLAALMLMGMMVVGAGAAGVDDFSDKDEIVNKDAVSMLTILGVINGKEDGSYYAPKDNVTRAEMAKMIATILNQGADVNDLYANLETGLTDIDNSWAKGYINYCYSLGIIAGRGNGTFDPTAPVTGNEAAKMLLVAIGYDPEVEGLTGASWAIKTTSLASTLGIFDDLTAPTAENLNRDNAALLIYNALDVEMIQKYEDGYAIIFDDHRTLLSNKYGVYKVEGVVTANEWAELNQTNSEAAAKVGKTTLDQVKVYASTTSNTTVGEYVEEKEPVTFNVSTPVDMLGQTVTMYIKKTTVLANSTVLGVTVKDDVNVIEGTVANSTKVEDLLKGTGLSVDKDTEYYVNYGYESATQAAKLISDYDWTTNTSKFNMNGVDVKLIDNNNDGSVEYVLYVRETLSNVVRTSTKDETVTINVPVVDANGLLTTPGSSTTTQVLDNADIVTDMDLAAEDLILYVQYGGRTYITEPTIVTGTMTRVDRDKADELYITVDDGETYKMSYIREVESQVDADITRFYIENAGKNTGAQFETKYDFILDSNGYIIAFRPAEDVVVNYGLVIGSAWTQNALTKDGEVKILTTDAIEATYHINWSASVGTNKAFANDTALETYLGTRDVNWNIPGNNTGDNLNNAVGTVIEYSLNEDNLLTIKNVLNLNGLNANDTALETPSNADQDLISVDDPSESIARIDTFKGNAGNLQYYLTGKYENGDGYVNVNVPTGNTNTQRAYAVDKNTIAFYFDDKDNDNVVDSGEYGVAIGWENMGDVAENVRAQVYPVISKNGGVYEASNLADVILFNAELTNNTANYMLVLSANAVDAKNLELNVVFEDGTTAAITVSKDDYGTAFDSDDDFMKAYKYSVDGNGKYTINTTDDVIAKVPASLLQNGTVDANGNYVTLVGTTSIWDVTDVDSANDDVATGSFDYVNDKWAVIVTTNSGKVMKTAWVWDMDGDGIYGTSCTFDWSLSNYETVYLTGMDYYDQMQIYTALNSGKNVMVMNYGMPTTLGFNLVIPAGLTVQFEGNLDTNNHTVTGNGNLRVHGNYTVDNGYINVPTQVGGNLTIETAATTYIQKDTHVAGTVNVNAATTVYTDIHVCADTLNVNAQMNIYGHVQANNANVNAPVYIFNTNTLLIFNNLTISGTGAVYVGGNGVDPVTGVAGYYAGTLTMGGSGSITGTGTVVVNDKSTLTLSSTSSVAMTNGSHFTVDLGGKLVQNYATNNNKNMVAGTITFNGDISLPGNVTALDKLNVSTTATGSIGGVFTDENGTVVKYPNVSSGNGSGTVTGLALKTLQVKGTDATIVGNTATVNLAYNVAKDTDVLDFTLEANQTGATITMMDSSNNSVQYTSAKTALSTGTYTIVVAKAGVAAVTYTLNVNVAAANTEAKLTGVTVKGVAATVSADGKTYTANLTYNQANSDEQQLAVTYSAGAQVKYTNLNNAGITAANDATAKGAVKTGDVTIEVTPENGGEAVTYTLKVVVDDAAKVTVSAATDSNKGAVVYQNDGDTALTTLTTVSDKDLEVVVKVSEGYENPVLYVLLSTDSADKAQKIDNGVKNADGTYTFTISSSVLKLAEGKTLNVYAEAEEMAKITVDSNSAAYVMVDGKQYKAGESFYVSKDSTMTVMIAGNANVLTAKADKADDKTDYTPVFDAEHTTATFTAYTISNIQGDITLSVEKG